MSGEVIEPRIVELGNSWLRRDNLDYKTEQEPLNSEIDSALEQYFSKTGGAGGNRPDVKLLIQSEELEYYPVLIEYKGDNLYHVKADEDGVIENQTAQNQPHLSNIKNYAVNGAVHYANALLHHTAYKSIIAIGMTGSIGADRAINAKVSAYFVSAENHGKGQKIGEYSDLSFLASENLSSFISSFLQLSLDQEALLELSRRRNLEIDQALIKLNNDIFQNEVGITEVDRIHLISATVIATLGIPKKVSAMKKSDFLSVEEKGNTDGDILMRKIDAFLDGKALSPEKKQMVMRSLSTTILSESINIPVNGESQLKRIVCKIIDDLGIYYKTGLSSDFTGKLFNEMYKWLKFPQDSFNDVVLTPSYVANLMVKLARINRDSYVWDFATGSGGLLVAAMNEMVMDAKDNILSPMDFKQKELQIKSSQILGMEILPSVYILAVLNMIIMGDGSSTILQQDSLLDLQNIQEITSFKATAFLLNPPFSAKGRGMIFAEKALGMMNCGFASIIIHSSVGSGQAKEYNRNILKGNTLLASIKMPMDIFKGKSNVSTHIYVFQVGIPHKKNTTVKFIDFSDDGYARSSRRKGKNNLKDVNKAVSRYAEVELLVRNGRQSLDILTENEYYEGTIDPESGADWNQSPPVDFFQKSIQVESAIKNYLAWQAKMEIQKAEISVLDLSSVKCQKVKIGDIFERVTTIKLKYEAKNLPKSPVDEYDLPCLTSSFLNQGLNYYVPREGATVLRNVITLPSNSDVYRAYFQSEEFTILSDAYAIDFRDKEWPRTKEIYLFFVVAINQVTDRTIYSHKNKLNWTKVQEMFIQIPYKNGIPDFELIQQKMEYHFLEAGSHSLC